MKKYLIIFNLVLISCNIFGQDDGKPDFLFQTISGGNNSTYSDLGLTSKGVFKSVRVQATVDQSPAYWGFYDNSFDYNPKWVRTSAGSPITINQYNDNYGIAIYDNTGVNGEVNITSGKYYTFNIEDVTNADADMAILETDFLPQTIDAVIQSPDVNSVFLYQGVTVTITTGGALNAGEVLWLRYTTDSWTTSTFVQATLVSGVDTYEAIIPAQNNSVNVEYYVLTTLSSVTPAHNTIDYLTLELRPEIFGNNYIYTTQNPPSSSNAPVLDGVFDGLSIWGTAVSSANGTAGWSSANAQSMYVTNDDYYYYFGAAVSASDWMDWGVAINTKAGGGSTEPWGRSISFAHTDLPDYVIKGHFGDPNDDNSNSPYAELRTWNGSSWDSKVYTSFLGEDETQFIEIQILKTDLDNVIMADIQFYITGNSSNHGTFDACPNDDNADQWDESVSFTILDNYQIAIALPVELADFYGKTNNSNVNLNWTTLSEINNLGFEIEKSTDGNNFETIGFVEGNGNSIENIDYSFIDENPQNGSNYYRLKQIDFDGTFEYSNIISVVFENEIKTSFYPNPTNNQLIINTALQGEVIIRLISMNGQIIYESIETIDNQLNIDVSDLNGGMYYLQVINKNSLILNEKFVKN